MTRWDWAKSACIVAGVSGVLAGFPFPAWRPYVGDWAFYANALWFLFVVAEILIKWLPKLPLRVCLRMYRLGYRWRQHRWERYLPAGDSVDMVEVWTTSERKWFYRAWSERGADSLYVDGPPMDDPVTAHVLFCVQRGAFA